MRKIKETELGAACKGHNSEVSGHGGVMCISSELRTNHLIAALPDDSRQRWLPRLERVELSQGQALHESGRQMSYAYFPTTAVVSLVYDTADGASLELAVVGKEGIVGVDERLDEVQVPFLAGELQIPSTTLRIAH